jgi:hypothetical protein
VYTSSNKGCLTLFSFIEKIRAQKFLDYCSPVSGIGAVPITVLLHDPKTNYKIEKLATADVEHNPVN